MALSLMKGGTFAIPGKVADKSSQPVFHFSPGSYNSQKGKLLLLISSLDSSNINFHSIVYPEENQTLEYATNLSPNMSGEWRSFFKFPALFILLIPVPILVNIFYQMKYLYWRLTAILSSMTRMTSISISWKIIPGKGIRF